MCGASLGFSSAGFSLTATATNLGGGASGIVDRDPNFGGLGVLDTSPSDTNDHVNGLNALTLTFTSPVAQLPELRRFSTQIMAPLVIR